MSDEVELPQCDFDCMCPHYPGLVADLARVTAERDELARQVKAGWKDWAVIDERDALRTRVSELEGALEKIERIRLSGAPADIPHPADKMRWIARAALTSGGAKGAE